LNSAVTLAAAFTPNTHPPNVVLVAFATAATLSPATWENPTDGPLRARAGTAPHSANSSDLSTAPPTPILRPMRTHAPPCCVPCRPGARHFLSPPLPGQ